jgi:hypothetical protein
LKRTGELLGANGCMAREKRREGQRHEQVFTQLNSPSPISASRHASRYPGILQGTGRQIGGVTAARG